MASHVVAVRWQPELKQAWSSWGLIGDFCACSLGGVVLLTQGLWSPAQVFTQSWKFYLFWLSLWSHEVSFPQYSTGNKKATSPSTFRKGIRLHLLMGWGKFLESMWHKRYCCHHLWKTVGYSLPCGHSSHPFPCKIVHPLSRNHKSLIPLWLPGQAWGPRAHHIKLLRCGSSMIAHWVAFFVIQRLVKLRENYLLSSLPHTLGNGGTGLE